MVFRFRPASIFFMSIIGANTVGLDVRLVFKGCVTFVLLQERLRDFSKKYAWNQRDGEYKKIGPTFGDFATILTEGSMQDNTVRDYRVLLYF